MLLRRKLVGKVDFKSVKSKILLLKKKKKGNPSPMLESLKQETLYRLTFLSTSPFNMRERRGTEN